MTEHDFRTPRMALQDVREALLEFEAKLSSWRKTFPECGPAWELVSVALRVCLKAATLSEGVR